MSHTPGPWVFSEDGWVCANAPWYSVDAIDLGDDGAVATVAIVSRGDDPTAYDSRVFKANARLIAAAPDLLEALERCEALARAVISGKPQRDADEVLLAAVAAIAKARGAS